MPRRTDLIPVEGDPTRCVDCSVRKIALFKGIAHENLDWTQTYRQGQYQLKAKQYLMNEGETSPFTFTLFSGWLKVFKTLVNGKQQVMRFALPGDFIGFQTDIEGPQEYSVRALTDVTLCAFPRKRMHDMMKDCPAVATRLAFMNANYMSLCQHYLLGTGQKSAKERLGFLLLELWHRASELKLLTEDGKAVACPLSQDDVSEALGLTAVHVNRVLKELREEGLASLSRGRLEIHDEPTLAEIAHFDRRILRNELL